VAAEGPAPPIPTAPAAVPFADKASGRQLLFAAYDAYRNAPSLGFTARWETARTDGTNRATGSEYLRADADTKRLTITTETTTPKRTVRRAIAGGSYLLATEFREQTPQPLRQFVRLPLEPGAPLSRSLQLVQFAPKTLASELRLTADWTPPRNAALIYTVPTAAASDTTAVTVVEIDAPTGQERARVVRTARFTLQATSHFLTRYEEWITPVIPPGRRAPRGVQATYRREEYTGTTTGPADSAVFSQSLPPGYQEQALPSVKLPPLPLPPADATPRALAALRRWRSAQQRAFTLHVDAQVSAQMEQRTPDARPLPANRQAFVASYTLWQERPDDMYLHLAAAPETAPTRPLVDLTAKSDGAQMRILDGITGNSRLVPVRNANRTLAPLLRQTGALLQGGELEWLLTEPPTADEFDRITLDETSSVLTLVQSAQRNNRRGRSADVTQTWRITLGEDALPRQIESRSETAINGAFERDMPPILITLTKILQIAADREPPSDAFNPR